MRTRILHRPSLVIVGLAALAIAVIGLLVAHETGVFINSENAAVPVPPVVYAIEAQSGSHHASILNLPIGYVGAPEAPIPVDVDGDLLPDVLVAVNLIDTHGIDNPPNLGHVIAPNVQINRYPLDLLSGILNRPTPPLRINVTFVVKSVLGGGSDTTVRFGYDTAEGGSIPPYWQATLRGLEDFYNPLDALIHTRGTLQPIVPIRMGRPTYDGPLNIFGGVTSGTDDAKINLDYEPLPDGVRVVYGSDGAGQHVSYQHGLNQNVDAIPPVDLATSISLDSAGEHSAIDARVERLPRSMNLDFASGDGTGKVKYRAKASGRLPDVAVHYVGPIRDDDFDARLHIEDLPNAMSAEWSIPEGDGPISATFDSSGQGIGALEATINNTPFDPAGLPPFVFGEKQHLAVQHSASSGAVRVGARLERIRHAELIGSVDGGFDGRLQIGDGELPLEVAAFLDERGDDGPLVDGRSTISPVPGDLKFTLTPPGSDSLAAPTKIRYESSEAIDVDGHVKVRLPEATSSECGAASVICGDLRIRHTPETLEARISDFLNEQGKHETRVAVDTTGSAKPDVFADVSLGPLAETEGSPIVAHAEVLSIADFLRARLVKDESGALERAEFHTCDRNYVDDSCAPGSEDRIGAVQFRVADFLPEDRPADLPPAYAATENFATLTARGHNAGRDIDFEATGRLEKIREFSLVDDGVLGVRTNVGGGGDLSAVADIKGIAFDRDTPPATTDIWDVDGRVTIAPLPEEMTFCLNTAGQAINTTPVAPFTGDCQDANPFETDGAALAKSPLSAVYHGSDEFNLTADFEAKNRGTAAGVADDHTARAHLGVTDLPRDFSLHVLDPASAGDGAMRFVADAPEAAGGNDIAFDFGASLLDADLECTDPRVPAAGDKALCASGRIEHLPTHVNFDYDPARAVDNLLFHSEGPDQLDLKDLSLSTVERDDDTGNARVLIAEGDILSLPRDVQGTLKMPAPENPDDPIGFDVTADPPIGTIDATVRNFVAPDPIPDVPAQRAGTPVATDSASFIQRGDAFKAKAHITSVRHVGYRTQVSDTGKKLDTSVVSVGFGENKVIRGYVDIDEDGTDRTLADVVVGDVPKDLEFCFRGKKADDTAPLAATAPTYCDVNPKAADDDSADDEAPSAASQALMKKQSAFRFTSTPAAGTTVEPDVYAFVRSAKGGGGDIIAANATVTNIPNRVQGTVGDGKADVAGYTLAGVPDGIDRIEVDAASFDLQGDGYADDARPFAPRYVLREPFPAPSSPNQHFAVRADDRDFEVRGRLGEPEDNGSSASDLHRVRISDTACQRPTPIDYGHDYDPAAFGDRPDFPHMPGDPSIEYDCIRADFEPTGDPHDQLELSLVVDKEGKRIAVENGLLDDVPEMVQIALASADEIAPAGDTNLPPHCVGEGLDQPDDCVPPLLRLDTPGNSTISGMASYGSIADLGTLDGVVPREPLPAFADPGTWGENGVRARVGLFADEGIAARAGFKLPIPASFTLDQVQNWSHDENGGTNATFWSASDMHIRYVARNGAGFTNGDLGRASAMIQSFEDGSQILLSDDDPTAGFTIPAELGLEMFTRDFMGFGRKFIQIDGRANVDDLDLRARMLGGVDRDAIGRLDAQIRDVPSFGFDDYDASPDPSFRVRAEIMGDPKSPPAIADDADAGGPPPKEDDCSPFLCVQTQVRVASVNVQLDFHPDDVAGAPPNAKLLEAVVHTAGTSNAVDVRGFDDIDSGGTANTDGRFLAGAEVSVDPINIFIHAGIPFLGSFDFVMLADLEAAVSMGGSFTGSWPAGGFDPLNLPAALQGGDLLTGQGTVEFNLRHDLLKFDLHNDGFDRFNGAPPKGGTSKLGPIDFHVDIMHGDAWLLFVKLIGVDWVPPDTTAQIPFFDCEAAGLLPAGLNSVDVPPPDDSGIIDEDGDRSVVAWPFLPLGVGPGQIVYSGALGLGFDVAASLAGPFFCLLDTDDNLDGHPSDPLGVARTGSTVPDAVEMPETAPEPVVIPPEDCSTPGECHDAAPDLTVGPTTPALCGVHIFGDVTVPAGQTLNVASSENLTPVADGPACKAGLFGFIPPLHLIATGTVDVSGTIQAAPRGRAAGGGGNSGGSHGAAGITGRGGNGGWFGASSPAYGSLDDPTTAENGEDGAGISFPVDGGDGGAGGETINIAADVVNVHPGGAIRADGAVGQPAGSASDCSVPDNPATTMVNEFVPNSGLPGGGGGAGGGIAITAAEVHNDGVISAHGATGGNGSRGAGGGGGGGLVKLNVPDVFGTAPDVGGGLAGAATCPADFPTRNAGQVGYVDRPPQSKFDVSRYGEFVTETPNDPDLPDWGFWHTNASGDPFLVPVDAAGGVTDDYSVAVCVTRRIAPLTTDQDLGPQLLPGGVSAPALDHPCGEFTDPSTAGALGKVVGQNPLPPTFPTYPQGHPGDPFYQYVVVQDTPHFEGLMPINPLPNGIHGVYTVVWRSTIDDNDCFDHGDVGDLFDDLGTCRPEALPARPDTVFGIDNDAPDVFSVAADGVVMRDAGGLNTGATLDTAADQFTLTWTDLDPVVDPVGGASGVAARQCGAGFGFPDCTPGQIVPIPFGDGSHGYALVVTDLAGNSEVVFFDVRRDTTPPDSDAGFFPFTGDLGHNHWWTESPAFRIDSFDDGADGSGPPDPPTVSNPVYEYQFDEGETLPCTNVLLCAIASDLPGTGRHVLHWTAIDKVDNLVSAGADVDDDPSTPPVDLRESLAYKVDGEDPDSEVLSVPASPNGANNWYSGPTWITFGAFDQPGGSGFSLDPDDASETEDIGGVYYSVNGIDKGRYTSPVLLDAGHSHVCWHARDVAGNSEDEDCKDFDVDMADPTTSLATTPAAADGVAGWFVSTPTLTAVADDQGTAGSGVDIAHVPSLNDTLCGADPVIDDPAPSGACISLDGAPFQPFDHSVQQWTLGEGLHEVRVFATDVAGRRSAITTGLFKVDLSHPVSAIRTINPLPARGRWWRSSPTVVLRAADGDRQNAGVQGISYRLDGGAAVPYTGPFVVPQGVHNVEYWSTDTAGRSEAPRTLALPVDLTHPTAKALSPFPTIWLRSLLGIPIGPPTVDLKWTVGENLSGAAGDTVNVQVVVYDATAFPVKHIDGGEFLVPAGGTINGSTKWNGTGDGLAAKLPVGVYYYRVIVTDAAGIIAESGESKPLQIKIG